MVVLKWLLVLSVATVFLMRVVVATALLPLQTKIAVND